MGQLKKLDFPGVVFKKNSCEISIGLGFWQGLSHNLAKFPEVKACFLQNF